MTDDIANDKAAVIHFRQQQWQEEWHKKNEKAHPEQYDKWNKIKPSAPDAPDLSPKSWMVVRWPGGRIVMDIDAFGNLSKTKQNKIMKLGGLSK